MALQNLGDVRLELRVRHIHGFVLGRARITQTRKHVCDRICHCHLGLLPFLAMVSAALTLLLEAFGPRTFSVDVYQLDFVTPGSSPR